MGPAAGVACPRNDPVKLTQRGRCWRTKTETRDGVVTLSGGAANQAEKDLVSKLTRDINGVKSVNNNMTVKA
jgi:hypothetical protein